MDEEEQAQQPAPPRFFRYKGFKFLTLSLLFLALFFFMGFSGLKATSSSSFCSTCHEMQPEYYTWKSSTHSEVDCVSCHIQPGVKNLAKDKAEGLVQVYKNATNKYTAPIQMPKDIPNSACETCHNMKTRETTPSGDLIIPHDKHLAKDIKCTECHSGVAHGKIAERNVTFKTDYSQWDETLGKTMMSSVKFTEPTMQECMDCHEAREVSTACKTCHSTGMLPKSHKTESFKTKSHGELAVKDVEKCNKCHKYMSSKAITGFKKASATEEFLTNTKTKSISAQAYAKINTFCSKCHSKRPASHGSSYVSQHGIDAGKEKQKCLTCHSETNVVAGTTTSNGQISAAVSTGSSGAPACASCHPATHEDGKFRAMHPFELAANQKLVSSCYTCHYKPNCTKCHKQITNFVDQEDDNGKPS